VRATYGTPPFVHLKTRVPASFQRALKLHCVRANTSQVDFIVTALREELDRATRTRPKRKPAR